VLLLLLLLLLLLSQAAAVQGPHPCWRLRAFFHAWHG
jgi:hypothetical protein